MSDDRTVLVTGATSGIGLEAVLRLSRAGFRTIGSARTPERAERLRAVAGEAGVAVEPVVLDLTEPEAGADLVPGLDLYGLVNNAGWTNAGRLADVSAASARRQLEAMVIAPLRLAQLALPGMNARGAGRIVNITSSAARVVGPFLGWYQAAKHALDAATEALRLECTDSGVEVVVIEPGAHQSNIWEKTKLDLHGRRRSSDRPEAYERALTILRALEPRMPGPDAVAAAIEQALVDERPRRRHRVGVDAAVLDVLGSFTPIGLREPVLRKALNL